MACIHKARIGDSSVALGRQMTFTGRRKMMYSPLKGRTIAYDETQTIRVTTPKGTTVDEATLTAIKDKINADAVSQQVDAQCDTVLVFQGVFEDTYKFRTWIAEEPQPISGRLFTGIEWAVIAFIISAAVVALVVVFMIGIPFTAGVLALLPSKPKYVGGTPENPVQFDDWAQYISYQGTYFWYVCPSCGAPFGSKTTYPNLADVPQAEKDAYNEHKENCPGLPKTPYDPWAFIIWGTIGFSAIIAVYFIFSKGLSRGKG